MDFILVSKDKKAQVEANASAYGNACKPVVLIDEEKLEKSFSGNPLSGGVPTVISQRKPVRKSIPDFHGRAKL